MNRQFVAASLLTLTTALWGLGVVATFALVQVYPPLWANAFRFVLAAAIMLPTIGGQLRRVTPKMLRMSLALALPSAAVIASDAVVTTTSFIPVTADDGSQVGDPRRITNGADLS